MQHEFKLFDTVALKEDLPEQGLICGQVGAIVEDLAPGVYLVEFSDNEGRECAMLPLKAEQVMLPAGVL